jgi:hypothetical protein
VESILPDSRAIVARTKDGRAIALLPLDSVRWTEPFATAVREAGDRAKRELGAKSLEMRLTGRASDRAERELKGLGWTVVEDVPGSMAAPKATAGAR